MGHKDTAGARKGILRERILVQSMKSGASKTSALSNANPVEVLRRVRVSFSFADSPARSVVGCALDGCDAFSSRSDKRS